MTRLSLLSVFLIFFLVSSSFSQENPRWQQAITYDIDVRMDVETHRVDGKQTIVYTNNSPDTLNRVFFHLYFNAFQPGSMMDVRSRTIVDPDRRVRDRILHLNEDEIGFQRIKTLTQNGKDVSFNIDQTILAVDLADPILPGESHEFYMEFLSQVPVQIRRSGRDNHEGIAYSMAQWYPKMAEYDYEGWHTHPYVAREFHGVWGDFDVRITIDSTYTIGGTGYLQNPQEIGHGYEDPDLPLERPDTPELTWHFHAPNVIDFMWGADDKFVHEQYQAGDGPTVHLFYVPRPETRYWNVLGELTVEAIAFLSEHYGEYPYEQFSVIQGGDGGMEYPMATLITGHRNLNSLVSVTVHELAHMWYQTWLATNESQYSWMDEGFTVYVQNYTMNHLFNRETDHPHLRNYMSYFRASRSGLEEPLNQQSDRYRTNFAFSVASYNKGVVFLHQLEYIIGKDAMERTMKRYFEEWGGRHPNPNDFKRIAEIESGLILGWYFEEFGNTTRKIDYAISDISHSDDEITIMLERKEDMFMPLDILLTFNDGSQKLVYIPTHLQLGKKKHEYTDIYRLSGTPWPWTHPTYKLSIPREDRYVVHAVIDPSLRLADQNRLNSTWRRPYDISFMEPARPNWEHYDIGWRPAAWYGENSGLRIGARANGAYIFGEHLTDANIMFTTGSFDDPSLDVDYLFRYSNPLDNFGLEAYLTLSAKRYYGIFEERASFSKNFGRYGFLETLQRTFTFSVFHQAKTSKRTVDSLNRLWSNADVFGLSASYTHGNFREDGFKISTTGASYGTNFSASFSRFDANKTFQFIDNVNTKFGMQVGTGSNTMPEQFRFSLATPTTEELWQNQTYWNVANISDALFTEGLLGANNGSGLMGYQLAGIGAPNYRGNNIFSFTIWNEFEFFDTSSALRDLTFELFSGIGKAWNGSFHRDFPDLNDSPLLASIGAGASYSFQRNRYLQPWRAQSSFLQDLEVSVRIPFYLHDLSNEDDMGFRFMIGVSERF